MSKFKNFISKVIDKKTLKFLVVGVINTIVGLGIGLIVLNFVVNNEIVSAICEYTVGGIVGYFLNKRWSFENKEKSFKIVLKYILIVGLCAGLALLISFLFVPKVFSGYSERTIKNLTFIIKTPIYFVLNYLGQRFFAFKKSEEKKADSLENPSDSANKNT